MVSQQPASFPLPLQWLRFGTPAGAGASVECATQSSPRDIGARLADLTAGIAEAERRLASLEIVDEAQHNQQARIQRLRQAGPAEASSAAPARSSGATTPLSVSDPPRERTAAAKSAAGGGEGNEAAKQEWQKWEKRLKFKLGMVYVAEITAVPVQVSKDLDSAAVCINVGGPELTLDQDDLVQAVGMDITQGPNGKSVPRIKIDCRSLIGLRTDAEELAPQPIYGWISVFVDAPVGAKGRPDAILTVVPEQHIKMGVKAILEARGGYIEPELLSAELGAASATLKVDTPLT